MDTPNSAADATSSRFLGLFELVSDGLMLIDAHGVIVDVNRTFYERLGYTRAEVIGMHIKTLDPPEFAARVPERLAALIANGQAVFESAHLRKDGTAMSVELNSRVIELDGENISSAWRAICPIAIQPSLPCRRANSVSARLCRPRRWGCTCIVSMRKAG